MMELNPKQPYKMTLQEYAEMIYSDPDQGSLHMAKIIQEFYEYKKLLADLLVHKITPRSVVGTGYVIPRKVAIEWLQARIAEYNSYVDRTAIHCVVKANYESVVRQAEREGNLVVA